LAFATHFSVLIFDKVSTNCNPLLSLSRCCSESTTMKPTSGLLLQSFSLVLCFETCLSCFSVVVLYFFPSFIYLPIVLYFYSSLLFLPSNTFDIHFSFFLSSTCSLTWIPIGTSLILSLYKTKTMDT